MLVLRLVPMQKRMPFAFHIQNTDEKSSLYPQLTEFSNFNKT